MSMDTKTVAKVAGLARLALSEPDMEVYSRHLSGLLTWVEQLQQVDTEGVAPLANVSEISLGLRPDAVTDGGYPEDVLANAPESLEGYFVVQKVVE